MFAGLTGLQDISLDDNSLTTLPEDVFAGRSGLRTLSLEHNSLASLPEDVFDGLTGLTTIHLNNNSLASLPEDVFDGLTGLTTIHLNNNSLASLPEDVFDGLTGLTTIHLEQQLPGIVAGGCVRRSDRPNVAAGRNPNPGSPFTFTAELKALTVVNYFKVIVSDAVPFDMTVTLSATAGTRSTRPFTVMVPGGSGEGPGVWRVPRRQ